MRTIPDPRGERVRAFRNKAGLSQEKLAEKANLNPMTIRRIERGQSWSHYTIQTLARVLQVKLANFYDLQELKDFIAEHDAEAVPVLESAEQPPEAIPLDKDVVERYKLLPGLFRDRLYSFTFHREESWRSWSRVDASSSISLGLESGGCIRAYCELRDSHGEELTDFYVYAIGDIALALLDMTPSAKVEVIASGVYGITLDTASNWDTEIDEPKQYEDHMGFLVKKILSHAP